ncbi:MAG TPA: hypothetical protein VGH74_18660 [Planctomycetaceae bacterium]|jgi:hypothetical protein
MRHQLFGKLTYDREGASWSGKRKFPAFVPFRQTPHGKGKRPTTFDVFIDTEDEKGPSAAQVQAFQYFVDHEDAICQKPEKYPEGVIQHSPGLPGAPGYPGLRREEASNPVRVAQGRTTLRNSFRVRAWDPARSLRKASR